MSNAIGEPVSLEPLKESRPSWLKLVKAAANAWVADYAPSMGAALSYYSVFSMAPLLLVVISIAGLVFGEDAVRGEVFGQLQSLLGADAAKAVQAILASVSDKPVQGVLSTVIGLVVLLIGATSVFGELQDALDRIWRAPVRDRAGGLWGLVRARLLSFGMVLGIAFLLMVSLVMGAAVSALDKWWSGAFAGWELLAQGLNVMIGFVLTTGVFAMIYKIMPRVRVQWRDVWVGAVVTALLFTLGRLIIGTYIGKSGVASAFGAAGSLIVVFVWVYYSAQIFGVAHLSMLSGFVFFSHQIGSFLGVWLGGVLYDRTGSYDIVWYITIALGIFAGLINLPVRETPILRLPAQPQPAGI